jgi:surface antigen
MLALGLAAIEPAPPATPVAISTAASSGPPMTALARPIRMRLPYDVRAEVVDSPPVQVSAPSTVEVVAAAPVAAAPVAPRRASVPAPTPAAAARVVAAGHTSGRFTYGYCTWWVSQKRPIPWLGNAWQWWGNAQAYGFAVGSAPRPGAIMVMGIGPSSPQGHVAYVESVAADGSFTVSEMNWWGVPGGGWGRVDFRRVTSMRGILGFIY